jgi:hypothetical protein
MQLSQIEMFEIVRCEFLNFPSSSLALDLFSYISRYCACFAAKTVCCPTCNCVNCANTVTNIYERQDAVKQILDRNPTAFESKFKNVSLNFFSSISISLTSPIASPGRCPQDWLQMSEVSVLKEILRMLSSMLCYAFLNMTLLSRSCRLGSFVTPSVPVSLAPTMVAEGLQQ